MMHDQDTGRELTRLAVSATIHGPSLPAARATPSSTPTTTSLEFEPETT
ncbi:MAG: hypothetical protein QOE71_3057 [Pseudonocardiales bacterium]|jgi:hypothetical protein|nr:hypothetical protein [Pseudonocardiales bacterium]